MIDLNDVLLAMSNIPVDDPIAEIWGRGLQGGYKIIKYTGSLPITINANGDALLDYRIYGADGGVGEPTENLFNGYGTENYGYYNNDNGQYVYDSNRKYWRIPVSEGDIVRTNGVEQGYGCSYYKGERVARVYPFTTYTVPAGVDELTNNIKVIYSHDLIVTKNQPIPGAYVPYGYKLPMMVQSENLFDGEITQGAYATGTGYPTTSNRYIKSSKIRLDLNGYITLAFNCPKIGYAIAGLDFFVYFWTDTDTYIGFFQSKEKERCTVQIPEGALYFAFSVGAGAGGTLDPSDISGIMLVEGSAPLPYQPYSNTITPVYIGENQLGEDEYVSFSEQKIYKDVSGTLTPTDPPVPLPEIPTIDGTTTIDYDGTPKPSQVYVKYKGKE